MSLATVKNVQVDNADKTVPLALPLTEQGPKSTTFTALVRPTVLTPSRALLRLSEVRAAKLPGGSIAVYLANAKSKRRTFVGVLSFFTPSTHQHGEGEQMEASSQGRSYAFDVTAQLQELFANRPESDGVEVALVETNNLPDEVAKGAKLYESSGIQIGEIKLDVETAPPPVPLKLKP